MTEQAARTHVTAQPARPAGTIFTPAEYARGAERLRIMGHETVAPGQIAIISASTTLESTAEIKVAEDEWECVYFLLQAMHNSTIVSAVYLEPDPEPDQDLVLMLLCEKARAAQAVIRKIVLVARNPNPDVTKMLSDCHYGSQTIRWRLIP